SGYLDKIPENIEEKLYFISTCLLNQLVYYVNCKGTSANLISLNINSHESIIGAFERFDSKKLFIWLQPNQKDLNEEFKQAFINYKLGNYKTALRLYFDLFEKCKTEELSIK